MMRNVDSKEKHDKAMASQRSVEKRQQRKGSSSSSLKKSKDPPPTTAPSLSIMRARRKDSDSKESKKVTFHPSDGGEKHKHDPSSSSSSSSLKKSPSLKGQQQQQQQQQQRGEKKYPSQQQVLEPSIFQPASSAFPLSPYDDDDGDNNNRNSRQQEGPGAVHIRGINQSDSSVSDGGYTSTVDEAARIVTTVADANATSEPPVLLEAVVVDDKEIRERVRQEILTTSVKAEVMPKRHPIRRWAGIIIIVAVIVVVVVTLSVVLTSNNNGSSKKTTIISQTLAPTPIPTLPPLPWNQSNVTSDFVNCSDCTILQLLNGAPNHTIVTALLTSTGVSGFLSPNTLGNVTFFAPADSSFSALSDPYPYYFAENSFWHFHLQKLLEYHIVTEALNTTDIFRLEELPTENGVQMPVNQSYWTVNDGVPIVIADIPASNGYIQVPDDVLLDEQLRRTILDIVFNTTTTPAPGFELRFWKELIEFAGMENLLLEIATNGITMFAPNDYAITKLGDTLRNYLFTPGNEQIAADVIRYHFTSVILYPSLIADAGEFTFQTVNGVTAWFTSTITDKTNLTISADAPYGTVSFNTGRIVGSLFAGNGFVNIIDHIFLPPNVEELLQITTSMTKKFNSTTFLSVVDGPAQLSDLFTRSDSWLTLFCPDESAFNSTNRLWQSNWLLHLQSLILHQVASQEIIFSPGQYIVPMLSGFRLPLQVSGSTTIIDGVVVKSVEYQGGMRATNGLVYFLDGVLLPPWYDVSLLGQVANNLDMSTLLYLLEFSNLTSILNETTTPLTLLAPDSSALSSWSGAVDTSNVTLVRETLLSHILPGNWYTSLLTNNDTVVVSLNNRSLAVQTVNNNTFIGGALVTQSNWLASNGVVHVINQVLGSGA